MAQCRRWDLAWCGGPRPFPFPNVLLFFPGAPRLTLRSFLSPVFRRRFQGLLALLFRPVEFGSLSLRTSPSICRGPPGSFARVGVLSRFPLAGAGVDIRSSPAAIVHGFFFLPMGVVALFFFPVLPSFYGSVLVNPSWSHVFCSRRVSHSPLFFHSLFFFFTSPPVYSPRCFFLHLSTFRCRLRFGLHIKPIDPLLL